MTNSNQDFTQKELLQMVIDRLDRLEEKLDNKLDKAEFYKVLGLVATVILIVGSLSMQGYMKAQVNLSQVLQGGLAALVAWLFNTVNTLQSQVAVYMIQIQKLEENIVGLAMRERELNSALTDVLIKLGGQYGLLW